MGIFAKSKGAWSYELMQDGEDKTIRIDLEGYTRAPSLESDPIAMGKVCDILIENPDATPSSTSNTFFP